jgi:hypothetical protein
MALGISVILLAGVAILSGAAAEAALTRLDTSATVFYGSNTGATWGSWAGGPPANIQGGIWEYSATGGVRCYTGGGSGTSDNWIGYSWATPQDVSNIVFSDGGGVAPFTIDWSTGGAGIPETWTWNTLDTYGSSPGTPHIVADLNNVRGIRVHSSAPLGTYMQLPELAVYGGTKPLAQTFAPATDPSFTTANTITPSGAHNINPGYLTATSGTRTHWLRWWTGGVPSLGGPQAAWKGSWTTPQVIGGVVLWGGAYLGGGGNTAPVDTYELYILKGGALPTSTDYANDWILVAQDLTSIALQDGAAIELLFPESYTTQGVALLQTGNPSGTGSGYENFSQYGGHLVILAGEVPEPASAFLLALAGLALLRRHRQS